MLTKLISHYRLALLLLLQLFTTAAQATDDAVTIAVLPDVHFHDIYGQFSDNAFVGRASDNGQRPATIRTMQSQLTSTRLFNENYFALLAALDDIAARDIKLVAMPGDFSDDGQPLHLRGLHKILQRYQRQYGIRFFLTPGNHDPVKPYSEAAGKADFLGIDGLPQAIYSRAAKPCQTPRQANVICSEDVQHWGYAQIMTQLADYGFFPTKIDRYWETPFSDNRRKPYSFQRAQAQSALSQRQYQQCADQQPGNCQNVTDASYLVEPISGLWILAIDANVYPLHANGQFSGSGNAGYNRVWQDRAYLLDWVADVAQRAKAQGKHLLTVSHFPMVEFYQGQADELGKLFGQNSNQLQRLPLSQTSQRLLATGVQLHVGGHMHMNDTAVISAGDKQLVNVQAPSIAAYVPAYKTLTFKDEKVIVKTHRLKDIPRFNELFSHYQAEYDKQIALGHEPPWDIDILQVDNYHEFANQHITALTRQRFIPREWPDALQQALLQRNGLELLTLSLLKHNDLTISSDADYQQLTNSAPWQSAAANAEQLIRQAGLTLADWQWSGLDLAVDFYRIRNAGSLALADISEPRQQSYRLLAKVSQTAPALASSKLLAPVRSLLPQFMQLLMRLQQDELDDGFVLDLATQHIRPLNTH